MRRTVRKLAWVFLSILAAVLLTACGPSAGGGGGRGATSDHCEH